MTTTVAIVENDRPTLELYRKAFLPHSDLRVVCACNSVERALVEIPPKKPDVILMDIRFPSGCGIACTRQLTERLPQTTVLMLTVVEDDEAIFDAIGAGAVGYILKSQGVARLIEGVRHAVGEGAPLTPLIARKIIEFVRHKVVNTEKIELLSSQEFRVLELVARGDTNATIASKLDLSTFTVSNYVRRIYQKLQVHSRASAVATLMTARLVRGRSRVADGRSKIPVGQKRRA